MPHRWRAGRVPGVLLLTSVITILHLALPGMLPSRYWDLDRKPGKAGAVSALETRVILPPAPPSARTTTSPADTGRTETPAPRVIARADRVTQDDPAHTSPAAALSEGTASDVTTSAEKTHANAADADGSLLYSISGRFAGQQAGGSARLEWKLSDSSYALALQVTGSHRYAALFSWRLKTQGQIAVTGMQPHRYEQETQLADQPSVRETLQLATPGSDTRTEDISSPQDLDPLSALFQLATDIRAHAGTPTSGPIRTAVRVRLADGLVQLTFEQHEDETVETPFGPLRTEKYVTQSQPAEDTPVITVWMAPELHYTPVRVRIDRQDFAALVFELASEPLHLPAWR